jgi:hypothetical protein
VGSRPDEVNVFVEFTESFQPHQALGFAHALRGTSIRRRTEMVVGSRAWLMHKAIRFKTACEATA